MRFSIYSVDKQHSYKVIFLLHVFNLQAEAGETERQTNKQTLGHTDAHYCTLQNS